VTWAAPRYAHQFTHLLECKEPAGHHPAAPRTRFLGGELAWNGSLKAAQIGNCPINFANAETLLEFRC
jgi:hypothetical protein